MKKLHKILTNRSGTNQSKLAEIVAAATSNSERELVERQQHNFEQEAKEVIAQGKITPQECYSRLAAGYATVFEQHKMICKVYEHIVGLVKHLNRNLDNYDARIRTVDAKLDIIFEKLNAHTTKVKKAAVPTYPRRLRDMQAFLFQRYAVIFLETDMLVSHCLMTNGCYDSSFD